MILPEQIFVTLKQSRQLFRLLVSDSSRIQDQSRGLLLNSEIHHEDAGDL